MRAVAALVAALEDRSLGRCEVLEPVRCDQRASEVHHRLPRSRARVGDEHLLDLAGDVDNLAHVCGSHHRLAHGDPAVAAGLELVGWFGSTVPVDRRRGLYVVGSVSPDGSGGLVYRGPSVEYRERVPTLAVR